MKDEKIDLNKLPDGVVQMQQLTKDLMDRTEEAMANINLPSQCYANAVLNNVLYVCAASINPRHTLKYFIDQLETFEASPKLERMIEQAEKNMR